MMQWLTKLFSATPGAGHTRAEDSFPCPWESHRQSIYQFISAYAPGSEPLPEQAQTLPDEEILEGELRWIAGGQDGTFGHHGGTSGAIATAEQLIGALKAVLRRPSPKPMRVLYTLLKEESALDYIDSLMEKLQQESSIPAQKLRHLMEWLARESPDRNAVKCAIALLGFFPSEQNRALVTTLGLHEEFTLFSAVALRNMFPDESQEMALVEMAKRVTGWGRIQLIERLPDEVSATTRDWLLTEGYSNAVMVEYTAWDCATKGQLLFALMNDALQAKPLLSAGEILAALICGGPARDIYDYPQGAEACHRYLMLLKQSADDDVRHLLIAHEIGEFARNDDHNWDALVSLGWSEELRQQISDQAEAIKAQAKWQNRVNSDLAADDSPNLYFTLSAAQLLKIDSWQTIFARQSAGAGGDHWYHLMQTDDPERIAQVISLAETQLDLAAIATGPDTQLGLGPGFQPHGALDFILQDLNRFPGKGWTLIKAGLRSPVIRNRNMALQALESWLPAQRPAELPALLDAAYRQEPDSELRARFAAALARVNGQG